MSPLVRLNLGAGSDIQPGYVNHDLLALPGIDVVHDLNFFPWPWPDASATRIKAHDVFEHVCPGPLAIDFMCECHRILAPGGILDIHTCGVMYGAQGAARISPNYFKDPTHIRCSHPETFDYWVPGTFLNGRYGAAYTRGSAVFEYAQPPGFEDGLELRVLLRKPVTP